MYKNKSQSHKMTCHFFLNRIKPADRAKQMINEFLENTADDNRVSGRRPQTPVKEQRRSRGRAGGGGGVSFPGASADLSFFIFELDPSQASAFSSSELNR